MSKFTDDRTVYTTPHGTQMHGDSLELLEGLDDESVDLIVTSPPFALQRKKAYGNEDQDAYVDWLAQFGEAAKRVLKDTGSLVVDIGNAYRKGSPTRSLYPYRALLKFVDDLEYHLAEEFFWYNPAKLPGPLEWVNKRRIRVKDAVNTIWWFSKTEWPKADVNQVLQPYSKNMEKLLKDPDKYYKTSLRPSEHDISTHFATDNGGAIPSNFLKIPNTDSNSIYLRLCRELGIKPHPARFPSDLPKFFILFLTDPGDVVVDIFSGSNTSGMVAEKLGRKWYAFEQNREYAALSILRFLPSIDSRTTRYLYEKALTEPVSLPMDAKDLVTTALQDAEEELKLAQEWLNSVEARRREPEVRSRTAEADSVVEQDKSPCVNVALEGTVEFAEMRFKAAKEDVSMAHAANAALDQFYDPVVASDNGLGT